MTETTKTARKTTRKSPAKPRQRKSTQVAKVEQQATQVAARGDNDKAITQMIEVIERVAMNPEVDVEKMSKMLDMQERIMDRQARQLFDIAMAEMQPHLPIVEKRGIIYQKDGKTVRSKYAKFEDINREVKPILSEYGFSMTFTVQQAEQITVTGVLAHKSGHRETTSITLGADVSGNKNAVQAVASSVSYGKRYTMSALLNLVFDEEDDDGESAVATVSESEASRLRDLVAKSAPNIRAWFYEAYESEDKVPKDQYAWLVTEMNAKLRKKKGQSGRVNSIIEGHVDNDSQGTPD